MLEEIYIYCKVELSISTIQYIFKLHSLSDRVHGLPFWY